MQPLTTPHIPGKNISEKDEPKISTVYYISAEDDLNWGLKWIKDNHLDASESGLNLDWSSHILELKDDWNSLLELDNKLTS